MFLRYEIGNLAPQLRTGMGVANIAKAAKLA